MNAQLIVKILDNPEYRKTFTNKIEHLITENADINKSLEDLSELGLEYQMAFMKEIFIRFPKREFNTTPYFKKWALKNADLILNGVEPKAPELNFLHKAILERSK